MDGLDRVAVHNLFGIEGLDIAWYGIIIASGIVAGVLVAVYNAKRKGYNSELIFDMMILALPISIIGARLYYVAFEWDFYAQNPGKIFAIWEGGMAIYGAIIGAFLAAFILCKWRKFPFLRLMDIATPGLILGQAIGRWGNFINQEAYGLPITDPGLMFFPYGVQDGGQWFLATFFYESMWNLVGFAVMMWYFKRAKRDGNIFAVYLIGYGAGRLWIEGVRIQTLQFLGMPVSQLASMIMIAIGVAWLAYAKVKKPQNKEYAGRYQLDWVEPAKTVKEKKSGKKD
jgi:phosphatidylglycerol:prolipoprotein diacylglycerol transferase